MSEPSIVLTGGHAATTAISVIKEIKKSHSNWKLFWIGPKSAVEGKFVPTLASTIMPTLGVTYLPLTTGRLQRRFTIWTIPSLLKIPFGFIQSIDLLLKTHPKVVVSFGGYASVPVCYVAWFLRIPVFIHEQTVAVGLANKLTSFIAKKIFIARIESSRYFPKKKTVLIGNPVSPEILKIKPKVKLSKTPTIYITGGSSGAQRINSLVAESLYDLVKKYKVIHQTGSLDFDKFKELRAQFPSDLKERYEARDFINPEAVPDIFAKSDLIISRGGANTLSEIMVTKTPSIIIPIPWTAYDEQTKNAKIVENTGIALVLEEKNLTPKNLLDSIDHVVQNWSKMTRNSDPSLANLDRQASRKLVGYLEGLM